MIFDNRAGKKKFYTIGYDLCEETAQISFFSSDQKEPETLSVVAGEEQYNIPAVLCKRIGVGQWFYGKEAERRIENGEGIEVRGLLSGARAGGGCEVDGAEYDALSLLTLFVKRTLSLLNMDLTGGQVRGIMFTTPELDDRTVDLLMKVAEALSIDRSRVFFQSHDESMYHYMLSQSQDLWHHESIAVDYDLGPMRIYHLKPNHNTRPVVVTIENELHEEMEMADHVLPEDAAEKTSMMEKMDVAFEGIMAKAVEGRIVDSVYLLGDGFKDGWMKHSLEFLCRTRRVFQGNNMFSKGAAIGAMNKIRSMENPVDEKPEYVLLGKKMLRYNIGMMVNLRGKEIYHVLLDAGQNWYEAVCATELILDEGEELLLQTLSLQGGETRELSIPLTGLPKRPPRTTKLRLQLDMTAADRLRVRVTDLGFGEFYPASEMQWEQEYQLS